MVSGASGPRRIRTGIALSPTELCAADLRLRSPATRGWRTPLDPPAENGGGWPSLAVGLAELARTLGVSTGTLVVSLMPPLTEVRRLELPPLKEDDLERLLSRNAARYFVNARGSIQIVGALATRRERGGPAPVIAAAAPQRLVLAIQAAAREAGWIIEAIAPAESAWAAAAAELWPWLGDRLAQLLVMHDDRTDLLQLDHGRLAGVRRFRAGAADAELIADAIRSAGGATNRTVAFGRADSRKQLARALSDRGMALEAPPASWADSADSADLLAAHFAGSTNGPRLRDDEARAGEQVIARKATAMVVAAAAVLFVLAGVFELWGVHRELRIVQDERAKIRPQLATTLVGRTTIEAAYGHLAALAAAERIAPHWSSVITLIAKHLPDAAFLTAVRTRGDSIVVDGLADRASLVFDALEKTPGLVDVRAAAPVRREPQEDGTALEHFTIAARLQATVAAAPVQMTPASNTLARKGGLTQ